VTYTRPDIWLGAWSEPDPIEAGAALVRLYLRPHGPTRIEDLSNWWARQPPSKIRKWFEPLGDELVEVDVEGRKRLLLKSDVARSWSHDNRAINTQLWARVPRARLDGELRRLPVADESASDS
jgi:Winged helix DNA-binding domain